MGIHGEAGIRRGPLQSADEIVNEIMPKILADLPYKRGDEVAVLVNGLGATPLEEQYVITRRVHEILASEGISVCKTYVGRIRGRRWRWRACPSRCCGWTRN